jgi:O-antigen/teichoic acid export membrane protein
MTLLRLRSIRRALSHRRPGSIKRMRGANSERSGEMTGLTRDAGWALVGRLLSKVAAVIIVATLARALSRPDFGAYLLIVSVAGVFSFVADLGLSQAVVLLVARADVDRDRDLGVRMVSSAWHLILLGGVAASLLAVSPAGRWLVELLGGMRAETVTLGLAAMLGILGVAKAAQLLAGEMFRGFGDIRAASLHGELLPSFATAAGILAVTVGLQTLSLINALIVVAAAPALMAGVSWLVFRRTYGARVHGDNAKLSRASPNRAPSKGEVLRESWPLLGYRLAMYLATQVDLWVTGALLGASAAASYGAATKLLIFFDLPLVVSNLALAPRIARYLRERRDSELQDEIRRIAAIVGVLGWAGLLLLVLGREPVLDVVFGSSYRSTAAPVLAILSVGHAVYFWSGSSSMSLIMGGEQRLLLLISALSAGVITGLALLLGEAMGVRGVALGAALGAGLHNGLTWFAAKRRLGLRTDVRIGALRDLGSGLHSWISAVTARRK